MRIGHLASGAFGACLSCFFLIVAQPALGISLCDGDVVISDTAASRLLRIDPITGAQTVIASGTPLNRVHGLAVAPSNQQIYAVTDDNPPQALQVSVPDGAIFSLASGGPMRALWDVAIGPGGNLLATDYNPGGPGSIFRISPSSGNVSTVATGGLLRDPTGIVLDVQGNAFVTDYDETGIDGRVLAVNLGSGSVSLVSTGINLLSPNGITRRSDGTLFIAETGIFGGALGKIVSVDPITGAQQVVASGGLIDHPTDLAFDSAQNLLITDITDNAHSAVIRLNVATGRRVISPNSPMARFHGGSRSCPNHRQSRWRHWLSA